MAAIIKSNATVKDKISNVEEQLSNLDAQNDILDQQIATAKNELKELDQRLEEQKARNKELLAEPYYKDLKGKVNDCRTRFEQQEKATEELLEEVETLEEAGGFDDKPVTPYLEKLSREKDNDIASLRQKIKEAEKQLRGLQHETHQQHEEN